MFLAWLLLASAVVLSSASELKPVDKSRLEEVYRFGGSCYLLEQICRLYWGWYNFCYNGFQEYICPIDGGWSDWVEGECGDCQGPCCDGFMECTQTRTCTNPEPQFNGYPCDGADSQQVEEKCQQPLSNCQDQFNCSTRLHTQYPDVCKPCSKRFVLCDNEVAVDRQCPGELVFSVRSQVCDFTGNVDACGEDLGKFCPMMGDGMYFYPLSRCKYVVCHHGAGTVMDCAPGTIFHPDTKSCIHDEDNEC